jgi:hypothetical protein
MQHETWVTGIKISRTTICLYNVHIHHFVGESFAGDTQSAGTATHSGRVWREVPARPGWVLLVRVTSSPP